MKIIISLFAGLLFFLLTPNILLRLPKNGSKYTVAGVHAVVFALAIYLLHLFLESSIHSVNLKEGATGATTYYTTGQCDIEDETGEGRYMRNEEGRCVERPVSTTQDSTASTAPGSTGP